MVGVSVVNGVNLIGDYEEMIENFQEKQLSKLVAWIILGVVALFFMYLFIL